jgi:hypothetical protein
MSLGGKESLQQRARELAILRKGDGPVPVPWVTDETAFVQSIRYVPIDSLSGMGQAMFLPGREMANAQYRFVNLRVVITHRSAVRNARRMIP